MLACFGGWSLDALDGCQPDRLWSISRGEAELIRAMMSLISSFGGWFSGAVCDRYGLVRMLQLVRLPVTLRLRDFEQLFVLRGLHRLGFSGEWAAAVLIGEAVHDKCRGRAVGRVPPGCQGSSRVRDDLLPLNEAQYERVTRPTV